MIRREKWTTKYDGVNVYVQDRFKQWVYVYSLGGYGGFDNNGGAVWYEYINIPITTTPSEYAQYKITITNSSLTVDAADGTNKVNDTTSGVWTNFWNNVKSDGSDIRVFDQAKSQLYFWVESFDYTNQNATIWVKLTAGSSELNVAYGNSLATKSTYENPEQTFEYFDDFSTTKTYTQSATKFDGGTGNTLSISNGIATITLTASGNVIYYANAQVSNNFIVKLKSKNQQISSNTELQGIGLVGSTEDIGFYTLDTGTLFEDRLAKFTSAGVTALATNTTTADSNWHDYELRYSSGQFTCLKDGSQVFTATYTLADSSYYIGLIAGYYTNGVFDYDDLVLLKYIDPAAFGTPQVLTF